MKPPFKPPAPPSGRCCCRWLLFLLLGCTAAGQSVSPADRVNTNPAIGFRIPDPGITDGTNGGGGVSPADPTTTEESQREIGNLTDQKDTLESELRYSRAKLDAARNRLDVASMAGHPEEADKWNQEVKDWETRVNALEAQIAQINNESEGVSQAMRPPEPPDDLILPGDNLELFVVEDPSFNNRYTVRRGGYIIMPAVGRIAVAGKTYAGAEAEVRRVLESTQLQHATVMLEKVEGSDVKSGPVIYLAGEFKNPRQYTIPKGTKATVVSVLLSCGGVTEKADLSRVKIMRMVENKSVVEEVNVQSILDGRGLSSDFTLNSGDVIMVPAGFANVIFITGRVGHPGSLPLRPGDKISAYAAILDRGGFARFADIRKVYVLRATPDGTKVRISVDIKSIQKGHAPDVPLQGNDIIVVPEKFFSF